MERRENFHIRQKQGYFVDNLGQIYFVKLPSFWLKRKVIGKEEETLLARELHVLLRMKTLIFS